jgi:ATP-binding cassette subfamily B multidrug efflux pump
VLYTLNMALLFGGGALGIWLWLHGHVSVGAVAVASALALRLLGMSHWIMWELSALFENIGTVHDGISSISLPPTVDDAPGRARRCRSVRGDDPLRRRGLPLRQGQRRDRAPVPAHPPGEKIGVVGRSGAGKSTLVNLLLRFHDVEAGRIPSTAGHGRRHSRTPARADRRGDPGHLAAAPLGARQHPLRPPRRDGEAEMIEAARRRRRRRLHRRLVDAKGRRGYDAQVGERGVKLSGGQRQRIAIARVLLKDAPILVLDEATSALDSEVEAAIQANLYRLMQGKTVIAIAHRLSTIAAMDRLVVMDAGPHRRGRDARALLARGGLYAQLWQRLLALAAGGRGLSMRAGGRHLACRRPCARHC